MTPCSPLTLRLVCLWLMGPQHSQAHGPGVRRMLSHLRDPSLGCAAVKGGAYTFLLLTTRRGPALALGWMAAPLRPCFTGSRTQGQAMLPCSAQGPAPSRPWEIPWGRGQLSAPPAATAGVVTVTLLQVSTMGIIRS